MVWVTSSAVNLQSKKLGMKIRKKLLREAPQSLGNMFSQGLKEGECLGCRPNSRIIASLCEQNINF